MIVYYYTTVGDNEVVASILGPSQRVLSSLRLLQVGEVTQPDEKYSLIIQGGRSQATVFILRELRDYRLAEAYAKNDGAECTWTACRLAAKE